MFDNFDDIVKVSFSEEGFLEEQSPERVLEFNEVSFESPVKVRSLDFSKSTNKKKEMEIFDRMEVDKPPVEDREWEMSPGNGEEEHLLRTVAKPIFADESRNVLLPKKINRIVDN